MRSRDGFCSFEGREGAIRPVPLQVRLAVGQMHRRPRLDGRRRHGRKRPNCHDKNARHSAAHRTRSFQPSIVLTSWNQLRTMMTLVRSLTDFT